MTTQKLLPALKNNHITNLAHLDEQNNGTKALYPLALEAIYGTMGSCNYELKNMKPTPLSWEFQSVIKACERINDWYKANNMYQSQVDLFFRAVERKNFEEVQRLLDTGTYVDIRNDYEDTALIFAASSGRLEAVKFLLDRGANVNARNDWDHTPLLLAANNGHTDIVSILLASGADVTAQDKDCDTALASAIRQNHRAIAKLIMNPAQAIQMQRNMDSAKEAMSRMAKRVYDNMLGSERGEELLSKAEEYNIPYTADSINWLKLINDVESYEELLAEAEEYNIAWDLSEYDPVGLQQEIEYCVRSGIAETRDLYRDYFDSRL